MLPKLRNKDIALTTAKWNVKYHKLIGKPNYDYFIDDKAMGLDKGWLNKFKKIIK